MNKQTEALKMAIEAMEATMSTHGFKENIYDAKEKAIQACKEALKQPSQEPVAWVYQSPNSMLPSLKFNGEFRYEAETALHEKIPLYTHPAPSWQGLKIKEIWEIVEEIEDDDGVNMEEFARAIETALRSKNS